MLEGRTGRSTVGQSSLDAAPGCGSFQIHKTLPQLSSYNRGISGGFNLCARVPDGPGLMDFMHATSSRAHLVSTFLSKGSLFVKKLVCT